MEIFNVHLRPYVYLIFGIGFEVTASKCPDLVSFKSFLFHIISNAGVDAAVRWLSGATERDLNGHVCFHSSAELYFIEAPSCRCPNCPVQADQVLFTSLHADGIIMRVS